MNSSHKSLIIVIIILVVIAAALVFMNNSGGKPESLSDVAMIKASADKLSESRLSASSSKQDLVNITSNIDRLAKVTDIISLSEACEPNFKVAIVPANGKISFKNTISSSQEVFLGGKTILIGPNSEVRIDELYDLSTSSKKVNGPRTLIYGCKGRTSPAGYLSIF